MSDPWTDPRNIVVSKFSCFPNFSHSLKVCLQQMPSPGIAIFVHGVNSDGEWYHQSEEGLCKGLNTRLKRCDEHLAYPSVEGGQLWPVTYRRELTDDGFVDPDRTPNTFIADAGHHSPVIQFRWGYKASDLELQEYGASIYLNEYDYWGGGPFANGCSSLPDLWGNGLLDTLFLWIHIEHLNPLNDAMVFSAPPRPYFVLAALRLAKLVESIRKEQADVPITLVCHSQGNMIGMAAAFLGDKMADVQDATGIKGRCVADTYVLCNPPYSVLEDNATEDWVQGQEADPDGNVGRQTCQARIETLKNFFKIVGQQADVPPPSAALAQLAANHAHDFTLDSDSSKYRCGPVATTRGKVTLYCNPHDQVISSTAIQGMGWRGLCAASMAVWFASQSDAAPLTDGDMMKRYLVMPFVFALMIFSLLSACAIKPATKGDIATATPAQPARPYMAQVVGVQWLNPLQRRDYSTEWQLLWTLGLAKPNQNDDKVRENPARFSKVQSIGMIASGGQGRETFKGYHHKYIEELITLFRQPYFASSRYFYNAHALKDKSTRRELAGIRVEYALPAGRLDPVEAREFLRETITDTFSIGNPYFPNSWTTATPPDVRVTMGGANAGFASLAAGLAYLQAHPDKTVWVMNWDAPSFPPKDEQIDENIALLILAGPDFKTQRAPLAWLGFPATAAVADYQAEKGQPPRAVQAWGAAIEQAAEQANLDTDKIAYVIHDAGDRHPESSSRIGPLAQSLTMNLPELDFMKQTFNTAALLGEMGAGTALTNVALAIAYANHQGQPVLVAGAGDMAAPMALVVAPPAVARPVDPEKPWFRARGEGSVFLPWWGLRHDAKALMQGYSH